MRVEVEAGINGCVLITDSFGSNLKLLTQHSLAFLEQQTDKTMLRTLILSDSEVDDYSDLCKDVNRIVSEGLLQEVVFIGDKFFTCKSLFFFEQKQFYRTSTDFLSSDFFKHIANRAILVKVASKYDVDIVLNRLRLLVHDTVLEIDFNALKRNVAYFRSHLYETTKLMCMVKASAYGSGSVEVSRALQHWGCDYLAVAFANEGVELRNEGIKLPILVLDPSVDALDLIISYQLEPEIYSFRVLNAMSATLKRRGISGYPIHLKLDSGMHRSGFQEKDLDELVAILKKTDDVSVVSVFSHLAGADEECFDSFTRSQVRYFKNCADQIEKAIGHSVLKHILNTSGIERFSEYQFDMVRLGIGLWGVSCSNNYQLGNVCTLKTRVMQLRTVEIGESIGYSRKGEILRTSKIAVLPLGYADGIDRRLGNGVLSVLIAGHTYPVIGNICMDLMMVDVTESDDIKEGDEVIVFGEHQSITQIANSIGTIPYEVLSSIAPRVRRVYFDES